MAQRAATQAPLGHDPWLARWLPTLRARAASGPVLEVGCGAGHDTQTLVQAGLRVVGFDLSPQQVQEARRRAPAAELHYRVEGAPKRFFDRTDIDALFAHGWRVVGIEHLRTAKYGAPKALWELALESSPGYRPGGA